MLGEAEGCIDNVFCKSMEFDINVVCLRGEVNGNLLCDCVVDSEADVS